MQTRSLKLRLYKLLEDKHSNTRLAAIAHDLGISDTTLRKYVKDEALTFERRVLERLCDYLNVEISDLIQLVPCDFFPHGSQPVKMLRMGRASDDFGTMNELQKVFARGDFETEEEICNSADEVVGWIHSRDCLIVGSPRNNNAGEVALAALFGAKPFDSSQENRRRMPIVMRVPTDWHKPTALMQKLDKPGDNPTLWAAETGRSFAEKNAQATAKYFPPDVFQGEIKGAKEFGVVLVADHKFNTQRAVRTYWVSGFSSVGTQAAARAVASELRRFSIDPGDEFTLAIIQAAFNKPANSPEKNLTSNEIAHTIRGTLPIPVPEESRHPEEPEVSAVQPGVPGDNILHDARRQKLRATVKRTWRPMKAHETERLDEFYDSELYKLPEAEFVVWIKDVQSYQMPANRRAPSLDDYLKALKKGRDEGPDLFRGE